MASSTLPAIDVRRLWPADMPLLRDHLLRLDSRSRHERFGGGMSDDFLIRYAQNCFGEGDLVFGAFIDGVMRGAAELRSSEAIWSEQAPFQRHIHAEAAFSVEEPYRRRASARRCSAAIEQAASNHGVETVEIVCTRRQRSDDAASRQVQGQVLVRGEPDHRPADGAPADRLLAAARGVARRDGFHRLGVRRAVRPAAPTSARRERGRDGAPVTAAARSSCP